MYITINDLIEADNAVLLARGEITQEEYDLFTPENI